MSSTSFKKAVWSYYRKHGRHALPWRETRDPYRILVSEVMLQQTQVDRVIPFYNAFLKKFPTTRALARAPLGDVLRAWQGLGYNRRAKYLHSAAKEIVAKHGGKLPRSHAELVALPGIGTYTAAAVRAFAWNELDVFIETNIRAAIIRHFFPKRSGVRDTEIAEVLTEMLQKRKNREWYWALMDYGSYLKKTEGNASRQSAHHVRQKPFKGSDREIRGAILKLLVAKSCTEDFLLCSLPFSAVRVRRQLAALAAEGLIRSARGVVQLPS